MINFARKIKVGPTQQNAKRIITVAVTAASANGQVTGANVGPDDPYGRVIVLVCRLAVWLAIK